jgi:hypothetical protein
LPRHSRGGVVSFAANNTEGYVQDNWKVNSRLT